MRQPQAEIQEEEGQQMEDETNMPQPEAFTCPAETRFRPLTRTERRNLWLKEYGEQDVSLQMWVQLAEQQKLEIEIMLQVHGLLLFGTIVSTQEYTQFYLDLNEEIYREHDPETADIVRSYHIALTPPQPRPDVGPDGLPTVLHAIHLRDVVIMSAGQKIKVPFWRGKISAVDGFVLGAKALE